MKGRTSSANDKARKAFEKAGGKINVYELARELGIAPSTIYRATWYKAHKKEEGIKA